MRFILLNISLFVIYTWSCISTPKGQMPKISLLKKYDLMQFADVSQAVIEGNLKLLNSAIEAHEIFFAKCGVYLIVDKLKIITYRNLFKRVWVYSHRKLLQ